MSTDEILYLMTFQYNNTLVSIDSCTKFFIYFYFLWISMWRNNHISFLTVKQCLNIAINIKYEANFTNIFSPFLFTT